MTALLAALLLAQPAPPCPSCDEDPAGVAARIRYERALRAEYDGRAGDAVREAQASLEQKRDGPFADAARALIERMQSRAQKGGGPRVEMVINSTLAGAYLSALFIGATGAGEKAGVAIEMIGTGGALAASIALTSGARVPDAMPQMLFNGLGYGTFAVLAGLGIAGGNPSDSTIYGALTAAAAAGGAAGLIAAPHLSGGDGASISAGLIWGGAIPVLIESALGPHDGASAPLWTALIGSTAGLFVAPVLNQRLGFSRGRWNLISLGGGVGALMGAGIGVLTDANKGEARGLSALTAVGSVAGLGLMAWLTDGFDGERTAFAVGIAPARFAGRTLPALSFARRF